MQSLGKTCLVKCKFEDDITNEGGIFVLNSTDRIQDGFWKAEVVGYGTLVTEKEKVDLPPIGSLIVMSHGKETSDKGGTKLVLGKSVYFIRNIEEILGVIE